MKKINLKIVVWKEGKQYVSQCLNVDVASYGRNKSDAINNLKDALQLYFEDENISGVIKVERPTIEPVSFGGYA